MRNFKTTGSQLARIQSTKDKMKESRDSDTGYSSRGNSAMIQQKARAMRNNDNGSHW